MRREMWFVLKKNEERGVLNYPIRTRDSGRFIFITFGGKLKRARRWPDSVFPQRASGQARLRGPAPREAREFSCKVESRKERGDGEAGERRRRTTNWEDTARM